MKPQGRSETLLSARGIEKRFAGVVALRGVGLQVRAGSVTAVVGENGAGKSTLMRILGGAERADAGVIVADGREYSSYSVREAAQLGIALIHQEVNLLPNLSIAANINLGRERHPWLRHRREASVSIQALDRVGLEIPVQTLVGDLAMGERHLVEIARALTSEARILIMDEPTSSLSGTGGGEAF